MSRSSRLLPTLSSASFLLFLSFLLLGVASTALAQTTGDDFCDEVRETHLGPPHCPRLIHPYPFLPAACMHQGCQDGQSDYLYVFPFPFLEEQQGPFPLARPGPSQDLRLTSLLLFSPSPLHPPPRVPSPPSPLVCPTARDTCMRRHTLPEHG